MIRIGIVGAENSHTEAIAKTLNIDKKVPGFRVTTVWGETRRYAKDACERGGIPVIVKDPEDMIGRVDAACVDHRHAKYHLPAVWPLLEAKIPIFVDKPFCYRVAEGKRFLGRAKRLRVPVCSFSVLPKQAAFQRLKKVVRKIGRIVSIVSTGPCDVKSKWGGVSFYGIHQVDMAVRLLEYDVTHVVVNRGRGHNHTATLLSARGAISTLNLFKEQQTPFHISVIGEKGRIEMPIMYDANPYLTGIRAFCRMFKTGKTDETVKTILTPVAVLDAMEKSIDQRRMVKVSSVT